MESKETCSKPISEIGIQIISFFTKFLTNWRNNDLQA